MYNSNQAINSHQSYGFAKNAFLFYNGFDLRKFKIRRFQLLNRVEFRKFKKFLYVGRNHVQKDVSGLIYCFNEVWELGFKSSLTIVSPDENFLKNEEVKKIWKKWKERLIFAGQIKNIETFYPNYDFICLKSISRESFPNVIGEGMLAGLPAISTEVGDIRIIVGNSGFLSSPRGLDEYTENLIAAHKLLFPDYIKMSKESSEKIVDRFTQKKMLCAFVRIIESVNK